MNTIGQLGVDGFGSRKICHQLANEELATRETVYLDLVKSASCLLSCYCPLELSCRYNDLWKNSVYVRPVSLTKSPEGGDVLST